MQNRAKECVGRFEEVCLSRWAVWLQSLAMLELQKRWRSSRVHSLSSLPPPSFSYERLFRGRLTFERNRALTNLLQVKSWISFNQGKEKTPCELNSTTCVDTVSEQIEAQTELYHRRQKQLFCVLWLDVMLAHAQVHRCVPIRRWAHRGNWRRHWIGMTPAGRSHQSN